jgi:hypothetical protein
VVDDDLRRRYLGKHLRVRRLDHHNVVGRHADADVRRRELVDDHGNRRRHRADVSRARKPLDNDHVERRVARRDVPCAGKLMDDDDPLDP